MPRHICDECERVFATVRALRIHRRIHRRIHTDEQPSRYSCNVCGWPCGNGDNLVQHMLIHASHEQWKEQAPQREWGLRLQLQRQGLQRFNLGDPLSLEELYRMPSPMVQPQELEPLMSDLLQLPPFNNTPGQIQQENVFGVPTTTYTQYTEHPNGTTTTVSTVNSPRGTAIVTTAQRPTSPITMKAVSQASGTFTSLGPEQHNNDCVLCLEPLSDKETRTTLCNHTFHKDCLLELSRKSNTRTPNDFPCPFCRQAITYDWLKS